MLAKCTIPLTAAEASVVNKICESKSGHLFIMVTARRRIQKNTKQAAKHAHTYASGYTYSIQFCYKDLIPILDALDTTYSRDCPLSTSLLKHRSVQTAMQKLMSAYAYRERWVEGARLRYGYITVHDRENLSNAQFKSLATECKRVSLDPLKNKWPRISPHTVLPLSRLMKLFSSEFKDAWQAVAIDAEQ